MIPRAEIFAWREYAPWKTDAMVEQDLVISRFIVEIFRDDFLRENLAFRGGTALYKLFLTPPARYSEDIDLVQIKPGPIGHIFDRLKKISFIDGKVKKKQGKINNTIIFSFDSEIPPVFPLKLKIEINCREHVPVFKIIPLTFKINTNWFSDKCEVTTYSIEELLGTKIRALYQRKKGRDLFDLWYALTNAKLNLGIVVEAFKAYMEFMQLSVSKERYIENIEAKLTNDDFRSDISGLIRPDIEYDIDSAWHVVRKKIIEKI